MSEMMFDDKFMMMHFHEIEHMLEYDLKDDDMFEDLDAEELKLNSSTSAHPVSS